MKAISRFILLSMVVLSCLCVNAQRLKKSDIEIKKSESPYPGRVVVSRIINHYNDEVMVILIDEYGVPKPNVTYVPVGANGQRVLPATITCNRIRIRLATEKPDKEIDKYYNPKEQFEEPAPQNTRENSKQVPVPVTTRSPQATVKSPQATDTRKKNVTKNKKKTLTTDEVIQDFVNYIESVPFYSSSAIHEESSKVDDYIDKLKNYKDKDACIRDYHLKSYIKENNDTLAQYSENVASLVLEYMEKFGNEDIEDRKACNDSIQAIINSRLKQRESNIKRLSNEINDTSGTDSFAWEKLDKKSIGVCAGIVLLLTVLIVWYKKANKKNRTTSLSDNTSSGATDASTAIVVRRKTTSILKKQSLEDVIGNDAYLQIDCNDFCNDSAVRRMYIKNTCIKEIYNMYAEDLRNPNNPKEDGCMVLGRWVYDNESKEYYVSLEHIVLPGDDAVFSEYELNFGGKIKLKVNERLRKLRRETNLQYDLTCWVHSHPGLGVFFSNSDSNVQMQLKHPTHPNFLTAMVVDILTPQQELGFFTFKRDSTINSKADLKKMYSLEELYKWAVESDRNSYKPEEHYNTLANSISHASDCSGIELSNGAIIDMGMLVTEQHSGLVGMVHGFSSRQGQNTEYVVVTVTKNEAVPDNELVGCFIVATHCSIPSIRKIVADYLERIKLVLVYTTTDDLLTSIPVVDCDICNDESYYGEQKLEDLKIWTRRKR